MFLLAPNPNPFSNLDRASFFLLFSLFRSDRKANAVTPELVKKLPFLEVEVERERRDLGMCV